MRVPRVSKRSTKKNANITTKKSSDFTSVQPVRAASPLPCVQPSGLKSAPTVAPNSLKVLDMSPIVKLG